MSTIKFTNAHVIDPMDGTVSQRDLYVADGRIVDTVANPDEIVDCGGKYLAPGIVDIGVKVAEPGERHKESYKSAGAAAAAGGVTTIVTRPDTNPPTKSLCP